MSKGIMFAGKPDNVSVISQLSIQTAKKVEAIVKNFNEKY
jgi:hypothetical protein